MQTHPIRLQPGQDLRAALDVIFVEQQMNAAFVLQGVGSLAVARLRLAGAQQVSELRGDFEILTLAGSLSHHGAHLHISVSDAQGRVMGGHVASGCIVRTTAEILIAELPEHRFARQPDPHTGFNELFIDSSAAQK